jgi:RNA polymerase sigma-70 factor (ECF subfamily)
MPMPHPSADALSLFEILVREHAAMLTAYLQSVIHDATTVDDLFQETMLTAWRTLDRYDRNQPFGPWLRGIAGKLILASRRQQAKLPMLCDEALLQHLEQRFLAVEARPGDTLDQKLTALRQCIEALPPEYRDVVQMRYRQELSSATVADQLKISMETLKKRLQRARAKLLACLSGKLASIGVAI